MPCKNCNSNLAQGAAFCHNCGEKIIRDRLTLKNLLLLYTQTFFNFDNKFFQTFLNLCINPEDVIKSYIVGIRVKYVNVLGYFALALTFTGIEYFIINHYYPSFNDLSSISAQGTENFSNKTLSFIQNHHSLIMICFIPVFTLIIKLILRKFNAFNYTELLVTLIYIFAHVTIIGAIISLIAAMLNINISCIGYILVIFKTCYLFYALKQLYHLKWKETILKALLFFILIITLYFFLIFTITGIIYLIKGQDYIETLLKS